MVQPKQGDLDSVEDTDFVQPGKSVSKKKALLMQSVKIQTPIERCEFSPQEKKIKKAQTKSLKNKKQEQEIKSDMDVRRF